MRARLGLAGGFLLALLWPVATWAQERWSGIDETVIERFAEERGRTAAEPFFNPEGDLLLFLFALAGTIAGFVIGYCWHKVFVAGRRERPRD